MNRTIIFSLFFILFFSIQSFAQIRISTGSTSAAIDHEKLSIGAVLDSLNIRAARADYLAYFNLYSTGSVFIGTDANERWSIEEFKIWAKPYFDRGRAWNFKSVERNIEILNQGESAWFDELLSTQMKICRGSGVLIKEAGSWKIKQYVLSMTIPNEIVDDVVKLKSERENLLLEKFDSEIK